MFFAVETVSNSPYSYSIHDRLACEIVDTKLMGTQKVNKFTLGVIVPKGGTMFETMRDAMWLQL